jgi:deoxycytidine triphosphate deaminase
MGLILGRSSLIIKGFTVHTGVFDSDYEGEFIVLMSRQELHNLEKGTHVAQLIIFPYYIPNVSNTV